LGATGHESHLLHAGGPDGLVHIDHVAVQRGLVTADINREIGVGAETIA
jgi:hypothetical protein